jgi:Fur family ferric uptake transcriptional regulator
LHLQYDQVLLVDNFLRNPGRRFQRRVIAGGILQQSCHGRHFRPMTERKFHLAEPQELKKAGLKATAPRLKILEILERNAGQHMRAEDVYKALLESNEDIGLATVYRVLTQLEQAGLVARHHFEEGHSVFELDQGGHHDHIVCTVCGRVDEFIDENIEERQKAIAKKAGYKITDHSLYIYGVCAECQKKQK